MATDFSEEFAELALSLHGEAGVSETVDRVLEFALKALDCGYAGVTFVHRGRQVETAAATHPLVRSLDQIQVESGEGPDIDVLMDHLSVLVTDTRTDARWPTWARRTADAGIRSMVSTRLYTSSTTIGTLNLYDESPGRFDVDDQAVAHVLARHAAVALAAADNEANLWQAIDARKLIGQAQGILMERFDLDADQAFAVLRRYSQTRNMKLRAVADLLVSTRSLPSDRPREMGHAVPMANIQITQDPAADALLSDNPFALLVGMMLDQQYPMEHAFRGPAKVLERFGSFDPVAIADADPDEFAAMAATTPAIHRFPGSMAARLQEVARIVVDEYDGDASRIWTGAADARDLVKRVQALPGFGKQKTQIFVALLAKQLGVRPDGWEAVVGDYALDGHRSVADVRDGESLQKVRDFKKAKKAQARA